MTGRKYKAQQDVAAAGRQLAKALEHVAATHKVHAAEVAHLARVFGVLANEIAGAAALLGTELAAWRVAVHGAEGERPAVGVRRIGRRT
jgi:hypothetical protein